MKHLTTLLLLFALLLSVLASCQGAAPTATLPASSKETAPLTQEKPSASSSKQTEEAPSQTADLETDSLESLIADFLEGATDEALWKEIEKQAENPEVSLSTLQPPINIVDGVLTIPKNHTDLLYITAYYTTQEALFHMHPHNCPIQAYFQKLEEALKNLEWTDIVFEGERIHYENGGFYFLKPGIESLEELWYFADFGITTTVELKTVNSVKANAFANTKTLEEITLFSDVELEYAAFANSFALKTVRCFSRGYSDPAYHPISTPKRQVYGSFGEENLGMDYASGGPYEPFTAYSEQDFQTMRQERDKAVPFYPTDDVAEHYVVIDGVLVAYNGIGGHVVIPEGVTEIRGGVFDHCKTNILEVTLPSTLKKICTGAFAEMPMLIALELPEGLEEIEPLAIYEDVSSIPFIHITGIPENCKVAENAFHDYQPAR